MSFKLLVLNLLMPCSFLMLKITLDRSLFVGISSPSNVLGSISILGGFAKIALTLLCPRFFVDRLPPRALPLIGLGLRLVLLKGFFLAIYFSFSSYSELLAFYFAQP